MSEINFKSSIKEMVLSKKLIAIGSLLLAVSSLLPWYSDLDRFNTGSTFLGVSGPLYLAGLITLVCGATSSIVILAELLGYNTNKLPLSTQQIHLFSISISVLMVMLTASVYFHPQFGMNISNKQMGFGMILACVSLLIMMSGSVIALKKKIDKADLLERHHESLKSIGVDEPAQSVPTRPYAGQKIKINDDILDERFSYFSNGSGINNNQEN